MMTMSSNETPAQVQATNAIGRRRVNKQVQALVPAAIRLRRQYGR